MHTDPLLNTPVLGGRYIITKKLGDKGAMGAVYEAKHVSLNEKIAIKVLLPQFNKRAEVVQRFQNEARAASELKHDNIIHMIDVGVLDGSHYIAMEFLEGVDLEEYLRQRKHLLPPEALEILVQVCAGLDKAHQTKIVHRDLKPANIFINGIHNGVPRVKLLDFGIAKLGDPKLAGAVKTQTYQVMGTPLYMSYEQGRGYAVDHRTDIYSLGAIAFELLTGEPPYRGNSHGDIIAKQLEGPHPQPIDGIPDSWNETILGALSSDVEKRPQSVHDFCKPLWAASAELSELAERVSLAFVNRAGADDLTRKASGSAGSPATTTMRAAAGGRLATAPPTRSATWRWAAAALLVVGLGIGGSLLVLGNGDKNDEPNRRASHEVETATPPINFDPTKPMVDQQPPASGKKSKHAPIKSFDPTKPSVDKSPPVSANKPSPAPKSFNPGLPAVDAKPTRTTITIIASPISALVKVGDTSTRNGPLIINRNVGERVTIRASLKGHETTTKTFAVPNKQRHKVTLTLKRLRKRTTRATRRVPGSRITPRPKPKTKPAPITFDPSKPLIE